MIRDMVKEAVLILKLQLIIKIKYFLLLPMHILGIVKQIPFIL